MKKIIAFLLASLFCLSFFSCASKKNNEKGNQPENKSEYLDHLPELDFGGQTISFVHCEGANGTFTSRSVKVDEASGDEVDDKIYEKTQSVQNRLNVILEDVCFPDAQSKFRAAITPYLEAKTSDYDVVVGYQYYDMPLATNGYILDFNKIPAEQNHLDLSAPYWATDYINELSYNGKTFWLTGDIALRYVGGFYSIFFNSKLYDEYLKEKYGDLYTIVKKGEWTVDLLHEMAATASSEDASGKLTKDSDVIGLYKEQDSSATTNAYAVGVGIEWSSRLPDGSVEFLFNQNNANLMNGIAKLYELISDTKTVLNASNTDDVDSMAQFQTGNVMFVCSKLLTAELYLREMKDDFGIVPMPKYDDDSEYRTLLHDGCSMFGISWGSENVEACTAVLELMAAESLRLVTPTYYDSALKYKYTRDDNSAEMIDIIRDSVYVDFALAWDNSITNNWIKNAIVANPRSNAKKYEDSWKTKFAELLATFK